MHPDAMRCDGMRCDAYDGSDQTAPSSEKFAGERLQSEVWPAQSNHSELCKAREGKRQTSKFHMAPRLYCVLSFGLGTYSLTHGTC